MNIKKVLIGSTIYQKPEIKQYEILDTSRNLVQWEASVAK